MSNPDRGLRTFGWVAFVVLASSVSTVCGSTPDELLREQGLSRVGSLYLLTAEDDLRDRIAEIRRLLADHDQTREKLAETQSALGRAERRYQEIIQKQRALEEEWPKVTKDRGGPSRGPGGFGQPPRDGPKPPPPGDGFNPPPPPDEFGPRNQGPPSPPHPGGSRDPFGPPGRMEPRPPSRAEEVVRLYGTLQAERLALETRIVQLRMTSTELARRIASTLGKLESRQADAVHQNDRIHARYATLKADSAVVMALSRVNELSKTNASLGPPDEDAKDLQALARLVLGARAAIPGEGTPLELKGMSRLNGHAGAAETLQQELATALGRYQSLQRESDSRARMLADQSARLGNLTGELARTTDSASKARTSLLLESARARVEKLHAEEVRGWNTIREALDDVARLRGDYLHAVAALRDVVDVVSSHREEVASASSARQELLRIAFGEKGAQMDSLEHVSRRLEEFEKTIHTEKVPVDWDRTILWVEATLNGKPGHTLLLAPEAREIRLSAHVAASLGVQPSDRDEKVEITLIDGRTITARRSRLASVQVGPFTAEDVACVLLPDTLGETPSLLGGGFLNRFAPRVDVSTGSLFMTQVLVKPASRATRGAQTKSAGSASKGSRSTPATSRTPAADSANP